MMQRVYTTIEQDHRLLTRLLMRPIERIDGEIWKNLVSCAGSLTAKINGGQSRKIIGVDILGSSL